MTTRQAIARIGAVTLLAAPLAAGLIDAWLKFGPAEALAGAGAIVTLGGAIIWCGANA